jgi:type II secretory pathway pseudopilin PulG
MQKQKMIFATNKQKSFTFIELLVIIIIIGILAGVSMPRFRSTFENLELENFVKNIFYLSQFLQSSSIGEGRIYYLGVDKSKKELQAKYRDKDELKNFSGKFGKVYTAPAGITMSSEPIDKSGTYFYPDGSIDKITLYFENKYKMKFSLIFKGAAGGIQIQ